MLAAAEVSLLQKHQEMILLAMNKSLDLMHKDWASDETPRYLEYLYFCRS